MSLARNTILIPRKGKAALDNPYTWNVWDSAVGSSQFLPVAVVRDSSLYMCIITVKDGSSPATNLHFDLLLTRAYNPATGTAPAAVSIFASPVLIPSGQKGQVIYSSFWAGDAQGVDILGPRNANGFSDILIPKIVDGDASTLFTAQLLCLAADPESFSTANNAIIGNLQAGTPVIS